MTIKNSYGREIEPFIVDSVSARVHYYDEDGEIQGFTADGKTIDIVIEKLGAIERKLKTLKSAITS